MLQCLLFRRISFLFKLSVVNVKHTGRGARTLPSAGHVLYCKILERLAAYIVSLLSYKKQQTNKNKADLRSWNHVLALGK